MALVTGVYLLFVYDIARPYESMLALQRDALVGRWMRALHRYASDAALVAVVIHVVRLVAQGKTWGPRTLAWISGVLLAGMMFLSALTGFVLVWDQFGQKIAVAGARILRLLPLFPEPPDRAFVGDKPVPPPFFFMNLFLHVAVPLGMICFLWLHTSRLARAAWFPEPKVVWGSVGALLLLSIVWPAPLPPPADLLAVAGRLSTDWFYGFWLPFARPSPLAALVGTVALGTLLLVTPWLLRPERAGRPAPASADPDKCEGCQQCFADCPYDAIQMVPGRYPDRHPLRADVRADLCVSCGLCAGSCSSLAIGPEGRTARHQLVSARALVATSTAPARTRLIVTCRNNVGVSDRVRAWLGGDRAAEAFEVDCAGTLHPGTVSYLGGQFAQTLVVSCPELNCEHREGATLAAARILRDRPPAVPGRIAGQSVRVLHASFGEWPRIEAALRALDLPAAPSRPGTGRAVGRAVRAVALTAGLLGLLALASAWPQGADVDHGLLRLGWRLTGQVRETCRDLSPAELAARPAHMRTPRECVSEVLTYDLTARVDGRVVARKKVRSPGLRADRPLSVEEELAVAPGEHLVAITFVPEDPTSGGKALAFERRVPFTRGRVALITSEADALVLKGAGR